MFSLCFPMLEIPGSLDFQLSPSRFPRILRSPSSRNPRFLVRASASRNTMFLLCLLLCLLLCFYYVFPRLEILGSLDFQSSPSRFPRILRSPSSRNPRFLVRASASRNTMFLLCLLLYLLLCFLLGSKWQSLGSPRRIGRTCPGPGHPVPGEKV